MATQSDDFSAIVTELGRLIDALRVDLREALEAVLPKLDGARACGRALGLKRGLGWKVYSVATASDLPTSLAVLPRKAGWELLFSSLQEGRCPPKKLEALRHSVGAVQDFLEVGHFRRPMLRALAAGQLDDARETAALTRARRAVREGSESIYGVRCAVQLGMYVIGPPDDLGRVDFVAGSVFNGLRRLRPGPPIAIKSVAKAWHPSWNEERPARPLGACPRSGWLVEDLSTQDVWQHRLFLKDASNGPVVYLRDHATGKDAAIHATFAELMLKGGTVGQPDDRVDIHLAVSIPTANCVFEAWIHRSIGRRTEPAASLVAFPEISPTLDSAEDPIPLPLEARARALDSHALPARLRAIKGVHSELLRRAAEAIGARAEEFVGFRVEVPDPPLGTRIRMRWRM